MLEINQKVDKKVDGLRKDVKDFKKDVKGSFKDMKRDMNKGFDETKGLLAKETKGMKKGINQLLDKFKLEKFEEEVDDEVGDEVGSLVNLSRVGRVG